MAAVVWRRDSEEGGAGFEVWPRDYGSASPRFRSPRHPDEVLGTLALEEAWQDQGAEVTYARVVEGEAVSLPVLVEAVAETARVLAAVELIVPEICARVRLALGCLDHPEAPGSMRAEAAAGLRGILSVFGPEASEPERGRR